MADIRNVARVWKIGSCTFVVDKFCFDDLDTFVRKGCCVVPDPFKKKKVELKINEYFIKLSMWLCSSSVPVLIFWVEKAGRAESQLQKALYVKSGINGSFNSSH